MPVSTISAKITVVEVFVASLFLVVFGLIFFLSPQLFSIIAQAQSQEDFGIARHLTVVSETPIEDGMVIAQWENQYTISREAYDKTMLGVVNLTPAIEITLDGGEDTTPVITSGTVLVRVNGQAGPIEIGDKITTSDTPGIAMKASKSGFILGIAEEAFAPQTPNEIGMIKANLDIKFSFSEDSPDSEKISTRLLDLVSISAIAAIEEPKEILRYIIGGMTLLGSVIIGFFSFTRTAQKGIDALGRNPLAKNSISFSIFANIGISFVIIAAGIVGAYFMITL